MSENSRGTRQERQNCEHLPHSSDAPPANVEPASDPVTSGRSSISALGTRFLRKRGTDVLMVVLLIATITLVWCTIYNRWTQESWRTPILYASDALSGMAMAKALATAEVYPLLPKYPESLGAPFIASWNDYPTPEEGVFAWWGLLVRLFGLFVGSNAVVLSAHLAAGLAFYYVARTLGYHPVWSVVAGILFANSHFAYARNLSHLPLTFYWHVPLGLLVAKWCFHCRPWPANRLKLGFCSAVAAIHGIQNPYYTGLFAQFLLFALGFHILRKCWREAIFPLLLLGVVAASFLVANADTIYHRLLDDPNIAAVARSYVGVELYALKPVELFLPSAHRLEALAAWANRNYFSQALFIGEGGSPYLGIVGIIGLLALGLKSAHSLANRRLSGVPWQAWLTLPILFYSVVGGLNGLVGLFGIVLFRATNRYSIVILCLALLFVVRILSVGTRNWSRSLTGFVAVIISLVALLDQTPQPMTLARLAEMHEATRVDRSFVKNMEKKLPPGAMLFQLPVMDFPEVPPIHNIADYQHFRPFLYSRALRFSYGSHKGRTRERWQMEAQRLQPAGMVTWLERYGFSAILINRLGYPDAAEGLLAGLAAAGRSRVVADSPQLVCIALQPSPTPILPPNFDEQWYGLEGEAAQNWRWSAGPADITLYNSRSVPVDVRVAFAIGTILPRTVQVTTNGGTVAQCEMDEKTPTCPVEFTTTLQPGENRVAFTTDVPGTTPGTGDPRVLAFRISDFSVGY